MISMKTRWRQLAAQQKASLRALLAMEKLIKDELKRGPHPLFGADDVDYLVDLVKQLDSNVEMLCAAIGFDPEVDPEKAIVALLGSTEGELKARYVRTLGKAIDVKVTWWNESKQIGRLQLEASEATPQVVRDRMLSFQFGALCRQAEAVENLIEAKLATHNLQFWVWNGEFDYAGRPEDEKA